jgi:hypothetical protein
MKVIVSVVALCTLLSYPSLIAQCVSGNCLNGKGTFLFDSGAKYSGEFLNGQMNGQGILTFTNGDKYLGAFAAQYREGHGKFIFANGDEYLGKIKKNKFHGEGKMKYADGKTYEGNWEDNKPNGLGEIRFTDGARYEGMVKDGNPEGEGMMVYANQTKFSGKWKNGKPIKSSTDNNVADAKPIEENKPSQEAVNQSIKQSLPNCNETYCHNSQGEYTYTDGSKYVGDFKNGYPEGQGTMQYIGGDRYVGGWSNHAPHGEGIMYYKTGRVYGGIWEYGNPIRELQSMSNLPKEHIEKITDADVRVWALVVGVGRYAHMPTLKYTDDDAYHFYSFLKSPEGGALKDEQVRVLIDEDATRDNILRTMRQLFMKADENDVVMLYFSGHGLEGSFIPVDYDGFNNKLRHDDIKAIFEESKAKHKVCMADACFSGSLLAMKGTKIDVALDKYYKEFENTKGGMALLMSSKSEEYSLEDHGLRSGIFSHYMIKGLKGEADTDKNKIITIKELYDFTYKNVRTYTAGAQTPSISGNFDPKMPIAVIR